MFELYKASLQDLLINEKDKKEAPKLSIKRDDKGIVRVDGAVTKLIEGKDDLNAALNFGHSRRKTQATKMNSESSRSHLVISNFSYLSLF
jgi:kinesin family protein C2/C3